ncbi:MAG: hypothetical protein WCR42_02945 [bacterium]
MKQAVFIGGFNKWGKTTIIFDLFGRYRFNYGQIYPISGLNTKFTVETHSNDDFSEQKWLNLVQKRIDTSPDDGQNLFTTLCLTLHKDFNFVDLLNNPPFSNYDKLHIFLIEYKYERHAKLMIDQIISDGQNLHNANFITINADQDFIIDSERRNAKLGQIREKLLEIFE